MQNSTPSVDRLTPRQRLIAKAQASLHMAAQAELYEQRKGTLQDSAIRNEMRQQANSSIMAAIHFLGDALGARLDIDFPEAKRKRRKGGKRRKPVSVDGGSEAPAAPPARKGKKPTPKPAPVADAAQEPVNKQPNAPGVHVAKEPQF